VVLSSSGKTYKSPKSTRSEDSSSTNDETGFVFCQLGVLQDRKDPPDVTVDDRTVISSAVWQSTRYILVAEIDSDGELRTI
jgi:hypothetical protein